MRQRALTIVAPVVLGANVDELKASLHSDGGGWQGGSRRPFADLETLHYLSCCVVDAEEGEPALVVLELNFDGHPGHFLTELVQECRSEVDRIFAPCEGYPGPKAQSDRILEFLREHHQRENLFYLGHPGRSVKQIREEEALRNTLRDDLGRVAWTTRAEVWDKLRPDPPAPKPPRFPFLVRYSLQGWRGPRRVLELLRAILWVSLVLAGVAAFCGYALFALSTGNDLAFRIAVASVSIAPLLVCLCVFRLRPRHLQAKGSWLVLREALSQGAYAFVYSAAVVGVFVASFPGVSGQWLPFSLWEVLALAVPWAVGLVFMLVLLVAITTVFYVLAGWIAASLAGAAGLWVTVEGYVGYLRYETIGFGAAFALAAPVLAALLLLAVGVALAAFYFARLRRREEEDAVAPARWDNDHLALMTEDEDGKFQNHFASVTTVKDGPRHWQLRAVLRLIDLLGKIYFNQGALGSIPSIHFARFIILKEKGRSRKRLLFLTNYDGGWPNYLGEFSHVAGVTLVWGNTELFPRPFLIAGDGSRDEQRFKTWARDSQIKTLIWYSAYPDLSVVQVNRNTRFSESLSRPLEGEAPRWGPLLTFWRHFKRPLHEAALDEELRSLTS